MKTKDNLSQVKGTKCCNKETHHKVLPRVPSYAPGDRQRYFHGLRDGVSYPQQIVTKIKSAWVHILVFSKILFHLFKYTLKTQTLEWWLHTPSHTKVILQSCTFGIKPQLFSGGYTIKQYNIQ